MARKDERGVVIPAPLQGSDAALAGRRYGDKHRGPAVADAYELWHCRIDLAERSEHWACPRDLPALMVELAQAVPEDQRADWLRRQANLEEVDRRISYAIRAGDLPIWVAPQAEPERLVATGALATIDKRSINSGVFCPLSEEYKSEADRPWLWERPLFVKWDDWVRFALAVDAQMKLAIAPDPLAPLLPPDGQFVSLSHALTWIAFGVSMDSDQLHEVLTLDRYGEHEPQEAIKAAVGQLVDFGRAERLAMQGKYRESHRAEKCALITAPIEPIKFADFRQFNYLNDELKHGDGLWQWRQSKTVEMRGNRRGGRPDSFIEVVVNRADLLREFRPHGAMGWEPEAIHWSDLEPAELTRVKQLASEAEADEWWNWPQAVAWIGGRSVEHIATMRLCAEQWRGRNDHQFDVSLGAERYLAQAYCAGMPAAEDELQRAIERGAIRTLGRSTVDSPSHELKPLDWRGGKIVYNRTATLVSEANLLSEWACDIAVHRGELWAAFPAPDGPSPTIAGGKVPANRQLNHEKIIERAREMRAERRDISLGSTAASIRAELPPNPNTGKLRDQRGIEKIIAHLWEGKVTQSPG
jgi:hypothetical protein